MNNMIVRTGLRVPYDLNTWLILEARKRGIPKNALILQILWNWMEHKDLRMESKVGRRKDGSRENIREETGARADDDPPACGYERRNPKTGG